MSDTRLTENEQPAAGATAFSRADQAAPFGPSFFLRHLGRFVRDNCPAAAENLPLVQLRLADGASLEVCHVIGVSPIWVILAVRDAAAHKGMAIEVVPYELIRRVAIRTRQGGTATVGFAQTAPPQIMTAETLLQAAVGTPAERG